MAKKKRKWDLPTIIVVIAAIIGVIVEWPQLVMVLSSINSNSLAGTAASCNMTPIKPPYGLTFYSQGDVFCIPEGKIIAMNISAPAGVDGISGISIGGSYSASSTTEFYVLNAVQYGEFLAYKDNTKNYTWYSGNNNGKVINATNLPGGETYYIVFYTTAPQDTITIERSINASYTYP